MLDQYVFRNGLTVQHADDAMAVAGVVFGVCYHDDGGALFVQIGEQLHYFITVGRVQVTSRFIGQDQLGVIDNGAGYGYTLLLTAGQLLRVVITTVHDLHLIQYNFYALFALGTFYAKIDEGQLDIFKHCELVDEVKALEYEADVAFAQVGPFAFVEMRYLGAIEDKAASIRIVEQTQDIQESGFPTAGRPHDRNEFSFLDFEAEVVQRDRFYFFGTVYFLEVTDLDHVFSV